MKTAVTIPDALFERAEAAAKDLSLSRSELYSRAVEAFLRSRDQSGVTESLNHVYATESSALDEVLAQMQFSSIPREEW
jgi:metal-responsive CopG/Arc/MetJ family transcriptional regulator